jgi:hypothetical protein
MQHRTEQRDAQLPRSRLTAPAGVRGPPSKNDRGRHHARQDEHDVVAQEDRKPQRDSRQQRELHVHRIVENGEARHDEDRHDEEHGDRESDEHRRVDERRDDALARVDDELQVADEAAQHLLELARALSGLEGRRVERRKDRAEGAEGVGELFAALHPVANLRQDLPEVRLAHALEHQVERLQQRQARLEQRRELLIEDDQRLCRGSCAAAETAPGTRSARRCPTRRSIAKITQALTLELGAQHRLARGGAGLAHHAPFGRPKVTDEVHCLAPDRGGHRKRGVPGSAARASVPDLRPRPGSAPG